MSLRQLKWHNDCLIILDFTRSFGTLLTIITLFFLTFCYESPPSEASVKVEGYPPLYVHVFGPKRSSLGSSNTTSGGIYFARKALVLIEHPSLDTHHQRMHWNQHLLVLSFFTYLALLNLSLKHKLNCALEYITMLMTSSVPICPY